MVYDDKERAGSLAAFMVVAMVLMSVGFGVLCFMNNGGENHSGKSTAPIAKTMPLNG
ncbi:MAG: hypothetical protein K2X93_14390 [Candidatus Obscuribacterales bacterium]|nr:hypothetical protein [Candidatus Obscuribacterales bacterium]